MFPVSCSLNPTDPCLLSYQVCAARHWAEAFDVVKSGKGPVLQAGSGVDRTGHSDGPGGAGGGGATVRDWESSAACWSLGVKGKGEEGSLLDLWNSKAI